MTVSRRIGLLGGTFDPPHLGHLDAAAAACRSLQLDEVRFIPAHDPPHRPAEPHASAFHRFALLALAIDGREGYRASDIELRRIGPSYTALTLRELHGQGCRPSQLFFIIGSDAFAEIATWYDFPAILDACHFAVIARAGITIADAVRRTPALAARIREPRDAGAESKGTGVFLIAAATAEASSSEIRERLSNGRDIDDLVPPAVTRYIRRHNLYRTVDHLHGQD